MTPTPEQLYQDHLIARRLPAWLRTANPDHVQALQHAMTLSQDLRERLQALLARLQPLDRFCAPLLDAALQASLGASLAARDLRFRRGQREVAFTSQPIGYPVTVPVYREEPALQAALENFAEDDTTAGSQLPGNRLVVSGASDTAVQSAQQFAALCRTLDLGGRYQAHLQAVLQPEDAEQRRQVHNLLSRARRYEMLADAQVARLKGQLQDDELQLVADLCALRTDLRLQGRPVLAQRLKLLGCTLEQILVLDVRDEQYSPLYTSTYRVLVHIPGDPHAPWRAFSTLKRFANALGKHLRGGEYQGFFARFVRRRDAQPFFSRVISGYDGLSDLANIDLEPHLLAWDEALFDALASTRIAQIKADAAMIAVPTAHVDEALRLAHRQRLEAEGWALLNLAGLFVPGLGAALLAVNAWQLLNEVFHGVQAWREGDTSEALDHLFGVASDLATMAAIAAGASLVGAAWTRAKGVDEMIPAQLQDGTLRLWQPDLAAWRSERPPAEVQPDGQGVYRQHEHAWVEMDGHHYLVTQRTDQRWQLRSHEGHAPLLVHNGAGAWRAWWEQPGQWEDPRYLLRRFGQRFARLDDEQADQVLLAHDLQDTHLRALQVNGQAPDAAWQDSAMRHEVDARLRRLVSALRSGEPVRDPWALTVARTLDGGAEASGPALADLAWQQRRLLFQRLYEAGQSPDNRAMQVLRRQFPTLHAQGAAQLLREARVADRLALEQHERVPLNLAESARALVRRIRVARVFENLYLDAEQDADLARVCVALLGELPGAPATLRLRLYEGSSAGPLLQSTGPEDATTCFDLLHLQGQFELLDEQGRVHGPRGELFEVLATAFDDSQRQALGVAEPFDHNLRVLLTRQAAAERQRVATLLGQYTTPSGWRLPARLADGRIGYPLSGRRPWGRTPRALYTRVRELYPNFNDSDIALWIQSVRNDGLSLDNELARLNTERQTLSTHLQGWASQPTSILARAERGVMRETLLNTWQRTSLRVMDPSTQETGYRLAIWALTLESLPELPEQVSFAHVSQIGFMSMGLREIPPSFLRAFPRLRSLELPSNQLTRLPPNLHELTELRELDLYDNNIVLDGAQVHELGNCQALTYLNLSLNPLGLSFSLARMNRLRRLHLRGTGIAQIPSGLFDRFGLLMADLRENQITRVPERFYRLPLWHSSTILMDGNPFEAATAQRLRDFTLANGWPLLEPAITGVNLRHTLLDALGPLDIAVRTERGQAWDELEAAESSQAFFHLLEQLPHTVGYQGHPQLVAQRVFGLLQAMREHASLREALFAQADLPISCQDSVADIFSKLELRMFLWQAVADAQAGADEQATLHVGRRLLRLQAVEQAAREDIDGRIAQGGNPDQVEVDMAYKMALRDELELPAQPVAMAFSEIAGITPERLAIARQRVQAQDTPENLLALLETQDFWQEHLYRSHRERFDALDEPFQQQVEAIMQRSDFAPSAEDESAINALHDQQRAARAELVRSLTRSALQTDEAQGAAGGSG